MIDRFHLNPPELDRFRNGPLGPHLDRFANLLSEQGYSRQVGMQKMRLMALLSRWLEQKHIRVEQLGEMHVAAFLATQKKALRRQRQVQHTLAQLLQALRRVRIIPDPQPAEAQSPTDRLLRDYGRFLIQERGLDQATLDNYIPVARRLLVNAFGVKSVHLDQLAVGDVNRFILREKSTFSPKRVQLTTSALRSFLGFLYLRAEIRAPLAASVPTVATWRLSDLPQYLEPRQVQQLLESCDRRSPCGRRDYAALLLLARLGLRAGEVVHLGLEDINWSQGEVLIRGKSAREDRLPLPPDVGRALAAYLQKDRPRCSCRRLFIRMKAPHVGFSSSVAVCDIVRRALLRAHLEPGRKGAHLLRHSLATRMLRGGASLTQIGQILRHQLPQTTEIYAKVDLAALRAVAQPWPGGVR
jgi:site-specific recombinase XerD